MKSEKVIFVLLFFLWTVRAWSQVGINTANPTAMLDLNGNFRLGIAEKCLGTSCGDSLLVRNSGGYVQTVSRDQILNLSEKSYVSGTGQSSTILLTVSGITNWLKIIFDNIIIDEHNDFDISNNTFTAPHNGIYEVYVQMKASSLVSAEDLGVGIVVKKGAGAPTVVAEESFININVVGVNVSSSTRKAQTIVALNAGDQIFFCVKTTLPSLSLISGSSSLFTIYQIK